MSKIFKDLKTVGPFNHIEVLELDSESKENHRRVVSPGDSKTGEPSEIQDAINEYHTSEIKTAYEAHLASSDS